MSANNSATLAGNIATEPELRFTGGGTAVCEFTLAINRPRSASGAADFVRVSVFGDDAEAVANYKEKGHGIKVEGRLDYQNWQAQDGSFRSTVKMIAKKGGVTFLPRKSSIAVNHVMLMGNLTRDPELFTVTGNIDKAVFGLAVDGMPIKGEAGDTGETETDYFNVVAWRGLARVVAEHKHKGDLVHIEGRITYSQWEKDGRKRSRIEVTADDIQFLPGSTGSAGAEGHQAESPARSQARGRTAVPAGPAEEAAGIDPYDDIPF